MTLKKGLPSKISAYQELEIIFTKLSHLHHLNQLMTWDEAVMMPIGGGSARAQALATLSGISHEILTQTPITALIEQAKNDSTLNPWQQKNLIWIEKKVKNNTCLPINLVKKIKENSVKSEQAWRQYRTENNWKAFVPYLETTFSLIKEAATIRATTFQLSPYDVMIDEYSPGITQAFIDPLFTQLKAKLPSLIESIIEKQKSQVIDRPKAPFDIAKQKQLAKELMTTIGFDFNHGRFDESVHPFCGGVPEDVRITTRYEENEFSSALLGICHETGHALYEQNLPKNWVHQPVGQPLGMALHESQSLIIEMQACRSREFMNFLGAKLQTYFGKQSAWDPNNLYKLYTKVARTFIRVDADEVTYPLHVILRYEIEKELFEGKLKISELPDIWNAKMMMYLGISTSDDREGVLQDVHWSAGAFGYFPAYTIGRLMAAQFFASAVKQYPSITTDLSRGDFTQLRQWLHTHVHTLASSVNHDELLKTATGEALNPDYFIQHIERRYETEL